MIELYKGDKSCNANKDQVALLKKKGWSAKKAVAPAAPKPPQATAPKKKAAASP